MVQKLTKISLKDPQNTSAAAKFYLRAKTDGTVNLSDLAEYIANGSTVSKVDVVAVLQGLVEAVPFFLKEGKTVRLGDIGLLKIGVKSSGKATADELSAADVVKTRVAFRPSSSLTAAVAGVQFKVE